MDESKLQCGSSGPRNLPLEYLRNITNNFSDERLLGEGGFGSVYKGVLPNGESMAVKKLNSSMPGVKDKQFENEAYHLMRLKHPNIVLLVGWCSEIENIYVEYNGKYICAEKSERLLCLEYMPKGNLRGYLSDESSGLSWEIRYKIIKDFGMSRLFSEEKTWTCTISRDGTLGYMAPEYINRGLISTKSDIFSLGVIIIEIVTGKRDYPDESETGISSLEFTELVLKNWRDRLQKSLRYTSLEFDYQQIRRCIEIGLDCVKLDRWKRPTVSQVIKMLHGTESADFSGRKDVMSLTNEMCKQQGVSTSEAPFEKKECQSSRRKLMRSNALVRGELDRPVSLALAYSTDNSFLLFCQSLGLSGPDEFAIPVAEWEAYKAMRSPSTPALTRPDVKRAAAGDGGIKGARPPPVLKPPPPTVLPDVSGAGSAWDIVRSFMPDEIEHALASRPARGFGHQDAVDKDEEAVVSEDIRRGESSAFWIANSSLSSLNSDEASSRRTKSMFHISPSTWLEGALLGSGSFGMVYEGVSE